MMISGWLSTENPTGYGKLIIYIISGDIILAKIR